MRYKILKIEKHKHLHFTNLEIKFKDVNDDGRMRCYIVFCMRIMKCGH